MEDVGHRHRIGLGSGLFYFLSYKSSKCHENLSCVHESHPVYMNFLNNSKIYCRSTSKMPVRCTEDQDLVGEKDE